MDNSELCFLSAAGVGAADSQAHGVASRHRQSATWNALKRSTTPFAPTSISPAIRPCAAPQAAEIDIVAGGYRGPRTASR